MVKNSRATTRTGGLLPLNLPQPAAVDADVHERPAAMLLNGSLQPVVAIRDQWRIDDEWWRGEISRQYFLVEFAGGIRLTVFQDLVTGEWYTQQYTAPVRLQAG